MLAIRSGIELDTALNALPVQDRSSPSSLQITVYKMLPELMVVECLAGGRALEDKEQNHSDALDQICAEMDVPVLLGNQTSSSMLPPCLYAQADLNNAVDRERTAMPVLT